MVVVLPDSGPREFMSRYARAGEHMSADDGELRDVVDAAWVLGAVTRCLLAEDPGVAGVAAVDAAAQDVMDARQSPNRSWA